MSVSFGDPMSAAGAIFAQPTNATTNYISNAVNTFMAQSHNIPDTIAAHVMQQHAAFKESTIGRGVAAIRNKIGTFFQADSIHMLKGVGEVQQAPDSMVRWIMANPSLRKLYHDKRVEGFGKRYTDPQPLVSGKLHYDYRRVMDGVVTEKDGVVSYSNFYDAPLPGDTVLSLIDKAVIRMAWCAVDEAIEEGVTDPSSEWNGMIG